MSVFASGRHRSAGPWGLGESVRVSPGQTSSELIMKISDFPSAGRRSATLMSHHNADSALVVSRNTEYPYAACRCRPLPVSVRRLACECERAACDPPAAGCPLPNNSGLRSRTLNHQSMHPGNCYCAPVSKFECTRVTAKDQVLHALILNSWLIEFALYIQTVPSLSNQAQGGSSSSEGRRPQEFKVKATKPHQMPIHVGPRSSSP